MAAIAAASLFLISKRLPDLKSERPLDSFLSRESAFLFNNLILVVACFSVLWGTIFPVLSEWVQGTKITVGPPYFNKVNIPIGLFLLFLTGVGPLFAWGRTSLDSVKRAFFWPLIAAGATCAAVIAGGLRDFYVIVSFTLAGFVVASLIEEFYRGAVLRARTSGENLALALVHMTLKNKRRYGGYIVHFSVVLIFIGLTGNAFNLEHSQGIKQGEEMKIGRYTLKMTDYQEGETANFRYGRVILQAFKDDRLVRTLQPERRAYKGGDQQTTTEIDLYSTLREDLYVVFAGGSNDGQSLQINAHVNPLVWWVWFGSAVMLFGSLITLLPDRGPAALSGQPAPMDAAALEEAAKLR
jgi:cytochrome c-type biogenesis protein CcmF